MGLSARVSFSQMPVMSTCFLWRNFPVLKCLLTFAMLACVFAPARAEEMPESEPFAFRTESASGLSSELADPFNYQGEPIVFRSFRIWPNLTLKQEYNDNVLATENNTQDDFVTVLKPELEIWKSFGRHDFSLLLNSEIRRHWDLKDENVENYNASFTGNLEARKGLDIPLKLIYRDGHLNRAYQRRSSATQLVKSPLNVKLFEAESGIVYKPNRLMLSLLGGYREVRLGNEELIGGGVLIRDNRNVDVSRAVAKVSYDLKAGLSPFVQATYANEDYINEMAGATTRNNDSLKILAGADFEFKGLVSGFFGVGVDRRSYDDASVGDTSDLSLDGEIYWDPTAKTRLIFEASRETSEDNLLVASLTSTTAGIQVQHELRKDIFARLGLHYDDDKFEDINRQDKTWDTNFEVLKIINPHLQIGAEYNYITRDSSIPGLSLDNNILSLRVKTAL